MDIHPSNVDLSKISYGNIFSLEKGGKLINIMYNAETPLRIMTPWMPCPFSLDKIVSEFGDQSTKYKLALSFNEKASNPDVHAFEEFMVNFDKKILEDALAHCVAWLGKAYKSVDILEVLYKASLKPAKDPTKFAPVMKISIQKLCTLFDSTTKQKVADIDAFGDMKGARVRAIIFPKIWITGTGFGVTWKVDTLTCQPNLSKQIDAYPFPDGPFLRAGGGGVGSKQELGEWDDDIDAGGVNYDA